MSFISNRRPIQCLLCNTIYSQSIINSKDGDTFWRHRCQLNEQTLLLIRSTAYLKETEWKRVETRENNVIAAWNLISGDVHFMEDILVLSLFWNLRGYIIEKKQEYQLAANAGRGTAYPLKIPVLDLFQYVELNNIND